MSYGRDRDRATRGVGAIAAADHSRARQHARSLQGRATMARDRAMAAITHGALGRVPMADVAQTYVPIVNLRLPALTAPIGKIVPTSATTSSPIVSPPPPPPPAPAPPPPPPSDPVLIGGGSPGKMTTGVSMGPAPVVAVPPMPDLPPIPDLPVPTSSPAPDNTLRNVIMVGGAAVAAWLYFRRRDS